MSGPNGTLKVRNRSGATYYLEEIDFALASGDEVDLLDESLPVHYDHFDAAHAAVHSLASCKLFNAVKAGILTVEAETEPRPRDATEDA